MNLKPNVWRTLWTTLLAVLLFGAGASAQQIVKEVRVTGNERLDTTAILFYTSLKAGAEYDPAVVKSDFQKLWETDFFQDLRAELDEVDGGVSLTWVVIERPILETLIYDGNDGVVDEDIEAYLSDRSLFFHEGSPFAPGQIDRARVLIEELFHERGYRFVEVETDVEPSADGGTKVVFKIDEGSKVKIKLIDFEGNRDVSDDKLRSVFKKTKQEGFMCFLRKRCVFSDANFNEDLENLNSYYWNHGYLNFQVGEPDIVSVGEGGDRRLSLRIPMTEGPQFRVRKVSVEGNTEYPEELLLAVNQVEIGEPFSREKMNETRQTMNEIYGLKGYFNVLIVPQFRQTDEPGTVDVVYNITEGEKFYIHRISFRGNTTTKDKVIRRQLRVREGDLFNTALFKRSLFRIVQLGYFSEPQPKIEPSLEDPTQLDITIDLQEQGRNDIRFGGGVSGVEGFFGTFAFSTRNLFGSGNTLTVDVQSGKQIRQYRLAYSNPWLFDRPISGGFDLFDRKQDFSDFERSGRGGVLQIGVPFKDFWFLQGAYRYEEVDQRPLIRTTGDGTPIPPTESDVLLLTDNRVVSSIQPSVIFSTIDNPVRPWRGFRVSANVAYSGGFLGGTTNLLKPSIKTTFFVPLSRRVNFGVHAEAAVVKGFGGVTVPLFEKFFLGGERSIRGFRSFQVSPKDTDAFGNDILVGGEKMLQVNTELQFKIASPVSLVLFADAANAYREDEPLDLGELKTSFGAEIRFWTPLLQAPLRLIWAYIPEPLFINGVQDPNTDFTFSIGTTF